MNWRQFLTPVTSVDTDQAKSYLADKKVDDVTILDVRQPKEYEAGRSEERRVGKECPTMC